MSSSNAVAPREATRMMQALRASSGTDRTVGASGLTNQEAKKLNQLTRASAVDPVIAASHLREGTPVRLTVENLKRYNVEVPPSIGWNTRGLLEHKAKISTNGSARSTMGQSMSTRSAEGRRSGRASHSSSEVPLEPLAKIERPPVDPFELASIGTHSAGEGSLVLQILTELTQIEGRAIKANAHSGSQGKSRDPHQASTETAPLYNFQHKDPVQLAIRDALFNPHRPSTRTRRRTDLQSRSRDGRIIDITTDSRTESLSGQNQRVISGEQGGSRTTAANSKRRKERSSIWQRFRRDLRQKIRLSPQKWFSRGTQ